MRVDDLVLDQGFAEERAEILKALGNPVRLRIVAYLSTAREATVGDLCEALALPQARVSQQLSALRLQGLVRLRKEDGYHHYSLAIPQLTQLLSCLARSCKVGTAA